MTVLQAYGQARPKYGATSTRLYAQGAYKWRRADQDSKGACFGLSMEWIAARKAGLDLLDLIGEEVEPLSGSRADLNNFSIKQHARYRIGALTEALNEIAALGSPDRSIEERQLDAVMRELRGQAAKLHLDEARAAQNQLLAAKNVLPMSSDGRILVWRISGTDIQYGEGLSREMTLDRVRADAAAEICKYPKSYVLVHISNHTMAAQIGDTITFFDPNGGEAIFPEGRRFQEWFSRGLCATDEYKDKTYSFILEFYT